MPAPSLSGYTDWTAPPPRFFSLLAMLASDSHSPSDVGPPVAPGFPAGICHTKPFRHRISFEWAIPDCFDILEFVLT